MIKPDKAFILAAGFGTRMRPLTNDVPKPMVEINGRSIIWHILDKLRMIGVYGVVVNTHYLSGVLAQHITDYQALYPDMNIIISHENDVLDTGGGVVKALPYFEGQPFYVIAGDAYWEDGDLPALQVLSDAWDAQKMDILTWMQPVEDMVLTRGVGDYDIDDCGKVRRSLDKSGSHMWTNIRINAAHIYDGASEGAFSVLPIMDAYEKKGRYFAVEADSVWHHISTPENLRAVDAHVRGKNSAA